MLIVTFQHSCMPRHHSLFYLVINDITPYKLPSSLLCTESLNHPA